MAAAASGSLLLAETNALVEAMTPDQVMDCVRAHVAKHAPEVEVIRQGGMLPSKTALTVIDQPKTSPLANWNRVQPFAGPHVA